MENLGANSIQGNSLTKYLQEGPIKAAFALSLMWGGLIYLCFCVRHEFFPVVDLNSLVSSIVAIAIVGLAVTVLFVVAPMMPSIDFVISKQKWSKNKQGFDSGFFVGILIVATLFLLYFLKQFLDLVLLAPPKSFAVSISMCVIFFTLLYVSWCRVRGNEGEQDAINENITSPLANLPWCSHQALVDRLRSKTAHVLDYNSSMTWTLSLIIGTLIALSSLPEPAWLGLITYCVWLIAVVMMNFLVAKRHEEISLSAIMFCVATPTLVLFLSGTLFSGLIDAPFRILGLGLVDARNISIDSRYAEIASKAIGSIGPDIKGASHGENVCIISRMGAEHFIANGSCKNYLHSKFNSSETKPPRVVLPASAVLSWTIQPK